MDEVNSGWPGDGLLPSSLQEMCPQVHRR